MIPDAVLAACRPRAVARFSDLWSVDTSLPVLAYGEGPLAVREFARVASQLAFGSSVLIFGLGESEWRAADLVGAAGHFKYRSIIGAPAGSRLWVKSLSMDTRATYVSTLVAAVCRADGPVLEVGSSHHSTPLLHELCAVQGKHLVTLDRREERFSELRDMASPSHHFERVLDLPASPFLKEKWGVAFVTSFTDAARIPIVSALRDGADYIVVPDADDPKAGMEGLLASFRYRRDFRRYLPHTTVVSNLREIWS